MNETRRIFSVSGNNKGLPCPFKTILCQEGYCSECQIYLDWRKKGELLVICAGCGKVLGTKPGLGVQGISHGMCPECAKKQGVKIE